MGAGPGPLEDLVCAQVAQMLILGGVTQNPAEGAAMARANLRNGAALQKFEQMVGAQVRHLICFKKKD